MRQELFHHANRPVQIDFNLLSDVFKASSFVVNRRRRSTELTASELPTEWRNERLVAKWKLELFSST
jgi:hypothetical protein